MDDRTERPDDRLTRREALAAFGVAGVGATAGCISSFPRSVDDPPATTTATAQFRGGLERRGVYPDATIPTEATTEWTIRGVNTGDHTAAKASAVPTEDGDVVVPGDDGVLRRVTPDGDVVWETKVTQAGRGMHGTPAIAGGTAYIGAYDGVLSAIDVESGDRVWRSDLGDAIGSSPGYHDGVVYIAVEYHDPSGAMFGVDATNGDVVWEDQRITNHPHSTCAIDLDAGRLVVGSNDGYLYAWTYPELEFAWKFQTDRDIKGPIATYDGSAFFGSWDDNVYRVDLEDGTERWSFETGYLVMAGPSIEAETDTVYIGGKDNILYALGGARGSIKWRYDAGDDMIGCPTVTRQHVLVGTYDKRLHAVEKDTGDGVWTVKGVGRVSSTPLVHDGAVYFTDRASEAYLEDSSGKPGGLYKVASGV